MIHSMVYAKVEERCVQGPQELVKLSFYARQAVTEKLSEGRPGVGRQNHLNKKKAVVVEVGLNFLPPMTTIPLVSFSKFLILNFSYYATGGARL